MRIRNQQINKKSRLYLGSAICLLLVIVSLSGCETREDVASQISDDPVPVSLESEGAADESSASIAESEFPSLSESSAVRIEIESSGASLQVDHQGIFRVVGAETLPGRQYRWEFGDGDSAEGVVVTHTFVESGDFDVEVNALQDGVVLTTDRTLVNVQPLISSVVGSVITVPGMYETLEGAIDAAEDGDVILLAAGMYAPSSIMDPDVLWSEDPYGRDLRIEKSLTLRGAGPSETQLRVGVEDTISIGGDGRIAVILEDLSIGRREGWDCDRFLDVHSEAHVTLRNVAISNQVRKQAPTVIIRNATLILENSNIGGSGIVGDFYHVPVRLSQDAYLSLENGNLRLVYIDLDSRSTLVCNSVSLYRSSIYARGNSSVILSDCTAEYFQGQALISLSDDSLLAAHNLNATSDGRSIYSSWRAIDISDSFARLNGCSLSGFGNGLAVDEGGAILLESAINDCHEDAIIVEAGMVEIASCRVADNGGSGLLVEGWGQAIVSTSEFEGNGMWGIAARDSAAVFGWGNTLIDNIVDLLNVSDSVLRPLPRARDLVRVPDDSENLASAVHMVKPNGIIDIQQVYLEESRVPIVWPLTIRGNGNAVIRGISVFDAAGYVRLENSTIEGQDKERIGIVIGQGNSIQILGVAIQQCSSPIISSNSAVTLIGVDTMENDEGIWISGGAFEARQCTFTYSYETYDDYFLVAENVDLTLEDVGFTNISVRLRTCQSRLDNVIIAPMEDSEFALECSGGELVSKDLEIHGGYTGINLANVIASISSGSVHDNRMNGIQVRGGEMTLTDCSITNNRIGIDLENAIPGSIHGSGNIIELNSRSDLDPDEEHFPLPEGFRVQRNPASGD